MKILFPDYYKKFICIADKCPDTCCAGWDIVIDGESLEKYASLGGDFGKKIRSLITVDEEGDSIFVSDNGRCPFLLKSGLCEMYSEIGHGSLCRTCRNFPRFTNAFGARRETGISLSCPEAARLIFANKNPVTFETEDADEPIIPSEFDAELYFTLIDARKKAFYIIQNRNFSVGRRICAFLRFSEDVQTLINDGEYKEISSLMPDDYFGESTEFSPSKAKRALKKYFSVFTSMEFINPSYPDLLSAAETVDMQGFEPNDTDLENLAVYFVFRYFITAAYDGNLIDKSRLAAVSLIAVSRLQAASGEDIVQTAQKFSKEVEHSANNMDKLMKSVKKSGFYSTKNLINILSERENNI